jgi:uncharacterized protein YmfQ (DUF2313 family)
VTAPAFSIADFTAAIQALMPRGRAWPRGPSATQTKVAQALAAIYQRGTARANYLLADAFPATAVELLPEWIAALGVPGPYGTLSGTTAGQQAQVVAAMTALGGQSKAYFIALAAAMGIAITITESRPWRVNDPINLPCRGDAWAFYWHITYAGGANAALEALIKLRAPAHTIVAFN